MLPFLQDTWLDLIIPPLYFAMEQIQFSGYDTFVEYSLG